MYFVEIDPSIANHRPLELTIADFLVDLSSHVQLIPNTVRVRHEDITGAKRRNLLYGMRATTLYKTAQDARNCEDGIRHLAVYQRKAGAELAGIAESPRVSPETAQRWLTCVHEGCLAVMSAGRRAAPAAIPPAR